MIQDIKPYKLNNHYRPEAKPDGDSIVLFFTEKGVLCRVEEKDGVPVVHFPFLRELDADPEQLIYAFALNRTNWFLLTDEKAVRSVLPEGCRFFLVGELRKMKAGTQPAIFAAMTGLHLYHWYRDNRCCGRCGHILQHDGRERALRCPSCGNIIYPKICPAVIAGVLNKDRLLVTKYRTGFPHYALVAGFTEIGETLEETVAREVMEETGLRVKNIRYYKSQPWGIADDLLAGFYCEVEGSAEIHLDENELKLAEWKTRDEIELQPDDMSLTNEMMEQFKYGRTGELHAEIGRAVCTEKKQR